MDTKICKDCCNQCVLAGFRQYSNGVYSATCKKCLNEKDKLRKKIMRKTLSEVTTNCSICTKDKPLKEFAKLKKNYKRKICLECYPSYLTSTKNEWCNKQTKTNANYRIKKSLASRLRTVMLKKTSTMEYIGCNIQYLRKWFEYNFENGMCWDNYGTYWSIDHVIPVSKFNLEIEEEKYKCWNWSNLVPVTVFKNSSKRNNIDFDQLAKVKEKIHNFKEEGSTTKWFSGNTIV
jgi:hypothetical protein